jgi:hypothetical protein
MPEVIEKLNMMVGQPLNQFKSPKRKHIVTEISNHLFNLQGKKMIMSISRDISHRKQMKMNYYVFWPVLKVPEMPLA